MKYLNHIGQWSESIHISNRVCFHSITTDPRVHAMGWGWRSKYSEFRVQLFFFVRCILILLAGHDSGELRCPVTALIDCHSLWKMLHFFGPNKLHGILSPPTSFITQWTSKSQILILKLLPDLLPLLSIYNQLFSEMHVRMPCAYRDADQPAHQHCQIDAFIFHYLYTCSLIPVVDIAKIPRLALASVAEQAGLSLARVTQLWMQVCSWRGIHIKN